MKISRPVFAALLAIVLAVSTCVPALAAQGNVSYVGGAEKFIFSPGSEYSPTDLFPDFKNVVPGDTLTQQIYVKNDLPSGTYIRLYIRSLGAQEGTEEFLSHMQLQVNQYIYPLFDATADQSAQLTEWKYLGNIYPGSHIVFDLNLHVDPELGNEFQSAIGYIDWEFKIEEIPYEPDDPDDPVHPDPKPVPDPKPTPTEPARPVPETAIVPKTGDESHLLLWIVLMVACAGMAAALVVRKKK